MNLVSRGEVGKEVFEAEARVILLWDHRWPRLHTAAPVAPPT
jgi:hypothetical protein